jgi:ABC-type glycerol-3-phosphate transport system permease component
MLRQPPGPSPKTHPLSAARWSERLPGKAAWTLIYAVMIGWALISVVNTGWIVMSSLKTNQELFANVWAPPQTPQWMNYLNAWERSHMNRYFLNSVLVSGAGVVLTAVVAAMASYILARFTFPGNRTVLLIFVAGLALPLQLIMVPVYLMFNRLHFLNSLLALTVMYVAISLPFSIFVLTGFFRTLPRELEEAAVLDGASEYQLFWLVMFPLAQPGLYTISIFNFLNLWNEYLFAIFLLNAPEKMTVPVGIYNLRNVQGATGDWGGMIAGLIIILVPTLIFYLIFQNRIVGGLTAGALKG